MAQYTLIRGFGSSGAFASPNELVLDNGETVGFEQCIIAAGSEPVKLPGLPDDPRMEAMGLDGVIDAKRMIFGGYEVLTDS